MSGTARDIMSLRVLTPFPWFLPLHRAGRPIGPMDTLVAAIALALGDCAVVTTDRDYLSVPRLTAKNWGAGAERASEGDSPRPPE